MSTVCPYGHFVHSRDPAGKPASIQSVSPDDRLKANDSDSGETEGITLVLGTRPRA